MFKIVKEFFKICEHFGNLQRDYYKNFGEFVRIKKILWYK